MWSVVLAMCLLGVKMHVCSETSLAVQWLDSALPLQEGHGFDPWLEN